MMFMFTMFIMNILIILMGSYSCYLIYDTKPFNPIFFIINFSLIILGFLLTIETVMRMIG